MAPPLVRERQPLVRRAVARVQADHAGQPLLAGRQRLGRAVGGGMLVVLRHQFAGQTVDVGGGGEELVHHVELRAAPGHAPGQRAQRRAHHAVVDQLAGGEALGVTARAGQHPAAAEGDQVGGGAADVDQHALVVQLRQRGMARAGQPVGRGDGRPLPACRAGGAPAGIAGEELQPVRPWRAQVLGQCLGDALHALLAVREHIGRLAGHGHRVVGPAQADPARGRGLQHLDQLLRSLPQCTGPLRHLLHPALAQAAGLDVGAADVPAGGVGGVDRPGQGVAHGLATGSAQRGYSRSGVPVKHAAKPCLPWI